LFISIFFDARSICLDPSVLKKGGVNIVKKASLCRAFPSGEKDRFTALILTIKARFFPGDTGRWTWQRAAPLCGLELRIALRKAS